MWVRSAGHCNGPGIVPEPVRRLVLHRLSSRLLGEGFIEATTLDHETRDDAMKHRVAIMAVFNVAKEIIDSLGGFVGIKFNHDIAKIGFDFDLRVGGVADGIETNRKSNSEKSGNLHDGKMVGNRVIG